MKINSKILYHDVQENVPFAHSSEPDEDKVSHCNSKLWQTIPQRLWNPLDKRKTPRDLKNKAISEMGWKTTTGDKRVYDSWDILRKENKSMSLLLLPPANKESSTPYVPNFPYNCFLLTPL